MNKLHIIMPFVNCAPYTLAALRTLRSEISFTIHLVDNRSTDRSIEIIRHYYKTEFIKNWSGNTVLDYCYNIKRKSVAESWNSGIESSLEDSECEYILIVNNDVIFHPKTIDHLIAFMDRTDYAMVTATNRNDGTITDTEIFDLEPSIFNEEDLKPITNWREEGPDFSCYLIKPKLLEQVGYFDENFLLGYFEDNDYHLRIFHSGLHAKRISTAPYFHYGSKTTIANEDIRAENSVTFPHNQNYFIAKWGDMPSSCMDGAGFKTPFDSGKPLSWWEKK